MIFFQNDNADNKTPRTIRHQHDLDQLTANTIERLLAGRLQSPLVGNLASLRLEKSVD
jgi:hypothetical protein